LNFLKAVNNSAALNGVFISFPNGGKFSLEEFEDTKGVIRIRKAKNRQHNDQKKNYKRTNNDLQKFDKTIKIKNIEYT
jgi:hypothetical protein